MRHSVRHAPTGRYMPAEAKELTSAAPAMSGEGDAVLANSHPHTEHSVGFANTGHIVHSARDKNAEHHAPMGLMD